jgi:hypothetical protein
VRVRSPHRRRCPATRTPRPCCSNYSAPRPRSPTKCAELLVVGAVRRNVNPESKDDSSLVRTLWGAPLERVLVRSLASSSWILRCLLRQCAKSVRHLIRPCKPGRAPGHPGASAARNTTTGRYGCMSARIARTAAAATASARAVPIASSQLAKTG